MLDRFVMNSLRIEVECAAQLLIILVTISLSSDLQDSGVTSGFKDAAHVCLSEIVRDPSPSSDANGQVSQDRFVGEFSPILASSLGFLPSLDHFIRSIQQRLRNGEIDLLGSLDIDHQLELRRLLDRQIGWLGSF